MFACIGLDTKVETNTQEHSTLEKAIPLTLSKKPRRSIPLNISRGETVEKHCATGRAIRLMPGVPV